MLLNEERADRFAFGRVGGVVGGLSKDRCIEKGINALCCSGLLVDEMETGLEAARRKTMRPIVRIFPLWCLCLHGPGYLPMMEYVPYMGGSVYSKGGFVRSRSLISDS